MSILHSICTTGFLRCVTFSFYLQSTNTIYHLFFGYLKLLLVWNFYCLVLRDFSKQASIDYPFTDSKENTCTFAWLKCGLLSAALWQSWWKPTKKSREIIRPHPTNVTLTGPLICSKTMFTSANSQTQYFIIFMTGNNQRLKRAGEFDRRSKRPCSNASALRTFHLIKRMLGTDVSCMRSNLSPAIIILFIYVINAASP